MTTSNATAPVQPVQILEPVSDDKNLLAPAAGACCCGGPGGC